MTKIHTLTNYDQNATHYDQYRRPSPIILQCLREFFENTRNSILSIGCGTGRMEQELVKYTRVVGLDRSQGMLTQAHGRLFSLIQGDMIQLPFKSNSFSGIYFMQSLHHIGGNPGIDPLSRNQARRQVLMEAIRVLDRGPLIIIQRDPTQNKAVWFWEYFPQALEVKLQIQPKISELAQWLQELGLSRVLAKPIYDPLAINFFDPSSPLNPSFRKSFSDFCYLSDFEIAEGSRRLIQAINDGSVMDVINRCKNRFEDLGGTVFLLTAEKT